MSGSRFRFASAVHLFLLSGDRILLLKRRNTGFADGQFSVIAGHLEGDELVTGAAIREAREEAGIEIEAESIEVVSVMHRRAPDGEWIDFFLCSEWWTGDIRNLEPEKCDELAWFPVHDLPANTVPYIRQAVDNYREGKWFASFGWDG